MYEENDYVEYIDWRTRMFMSIFLL